MISIILPVYNAKEFLELALASIFATTLNDFELIIIDDHSKKKTREYVMSIDAPQINVTTILNFKHEWTNHNWNQGIALAKGEYIAILNSDIKLSKHWDKYLIKALETSTIACPYELTSNQTLYSLSPFMKRNAPNMIKGPAFMFKKSDASQLFPIPKQIKHWCGDNVLADRAEKMSGVKFAKRAVIIHYISKSAATIKKSTYDKRIYKDLLAYEKWSGKNMDFIKAQFKDLKI